MAKKKCPVCGAKNSKERMTCIECGAPFAVEQVEGQLARVSTKAEAQVETVIEKAPEERAADEYRDNEKVLYSTTKQTADHRKSAWFWVGVVLLSISALLWLIIILVIVSKSDGAGILVGVLLTTIPIGIGIYGIRRGRKADLP